MNLQPVYLLAVICVLTGLVAGLLIVQSIPQNGRYQLQAVGDSATCYVIDTKTGETIFLTVNHVLGRVPFNQELTPTAPSN